MICTGVRIRIQQIHVKDMMVSEREREREREGEGEGEREREREGERLKLMRQKTFRSC